MSIQFQLVGRYGCHLCDDMMDHLNALKAEYEFDVVTVDVGSDAELEQRYGLKVPVLMHQQQEICHFTLDVERFRDIMEQLKNT